ncbi:MAG: ABC-2 family transporter protein [Candidatus Woesearchaeota archaeon]
MRMWFHSAKLRIAQRMAYRGEYLISLITMFAVELIAPFFAYIMYYNTAGFTGWSIYQIIMMQGILMTVKGFSYFSFHGIVWNSNALLQRGEFDMVLLRPRNPLWMFICLSFDAEDIAKFGGGLLIMGFALAHIEFKLMGFLTMLILMLTAIGLYFFFALILSSIVFRVIQSWRIYELVEIIELVGEYPKSVYPKYVGLFFTTLIPIFIAGFIPAQALFGNYSWEMVLAPACLMGLVILSLIIWFRTIRNYASAGG